MGDGLLEAEYVSWECEGYGTSATRRRGYEGYRVHRHEVYGRCQTRYLVWQFPEEVREAVLAANQSDSMPSGIQAAQDLTGLRLSHCTELVLVLKELALEGQP